MIFYISKKIKIFFLLFVFSIFVNMPVDVYADTFYSPDIARIIERGKLIVAMVNTDNPPFFMTDAQGHLYGIDVDLANDIAASLGVEVEFNRTSKTFDGVVDLVAARETDVAISFLSKTLERGKKIVFTKTYLSVYQTVVVNRIAAAQRKWGKTPLESMNDATVRIGTLKGSSYFEFVQRLLPNAEIVPYDDLSVAFTDAKNGKIQAALFDDIYVTDWLSSHPDAALYLQTIVLKDKEDPLAMAVHWEDIHLREWLNQYLDMRMKDGTVDKIINKYSGRRK